MIVTSVKKKIIEIVFCFGVLTDLIGKSNVAILSHYSFLEYFLTFVNDVHVYIPCPTSFMPIQSLVSSSFV